MSALYLALLELPVSEALALLLQHNLRRYGNDLYHAPGFYISGTKFLRAPLAEPLYLYSIVGTLGKDSATLCESAELPK